MGKNGRITINQEKEIIMQITAKSWNIWRPQLYVICRSLIETTKRLEIVPLKDRASIAEEWKINDLDSSEFEIIQRVK